MVPINWNIGMLLRRLGCLRKLFCTKMSSTHVERTADSSRDDVFSWVSVTAISQLSPTVKGFTLQVTDKKLSFLPGQWVDLHIPEQDVIGGYSIVSPPRQLAEKLTFDLAIKYSDHPPTLWMSTKCEVGDRLMIRVGGDFHLSPGVGGLTDLLLIAGGVGMNPLFSMLTHHVGMLSQVDEGKGRVELLYSAKMESELLFKDEITRISSETDKVKAQYFVTSQNESDCSPSVKCGRVCSADVANALRGLDRDNVRCYVCGPPPLTEAVTEILTRNYVKQCQIHFEKWW